MRRDGVVSRRGDTDGEAVGHANARLRNALRLRLRSSLEASERTLEAALVTIEPGTTMREWAKRQAGGPTSTEIPTPTGIVTVTISWRDGREIRFPVGEDLIAETPTFAVFLREIIDALNGVGLRGGG